LGGKPERKRELGRPRCSWLKYIKMNLSEIEYEVVDFVYWLRTGSS
jgi:hypothetical protein